MGIFNFNRKQETPKPEVRSAAMGALTYRMGGNTMRGKRAMALSTVYRCVDVISDSVAMLPCEPYIIDRKGFKRKYLEHPTYRILNAAPNKRMSRFVFMKMLAVSTLLDGNGYAHIQRDDNGRVVSLRFLNPNDVTVNIPEDIDAEVTYSVRGIGRVEACNMIHIVNFSYDGITGISTLQNAYNTIGLAADQEAHAMGFFKGGANVAGILKVLGALTEEAKKGLQSSWQEAFNPTTGHPNGVAVIEGNMEFQPITVKPTDSQLLESRQFSTEEICRFFGVQPSKVFDFAHSSYNSVEAMQLAFLTDTLQPFLEKIELEFERKLYLPSERETIDVRFDTSAILRTDKKSLAEYYTKLFYLGVMSPNDIRKALDLTPIEGGDRYFLQVNLQTIENAINNVAQNPKSIQ